MVTPAGVKVLDFALARLYAPGTPGSRMVGALFYMSPEWAMGGPVDARSDVFALGLVLYEMLCGRRPFPGITTLVTLSAILNTWPDPPRKLRPEIPAAIEQIVLRCLEKQPEARFASAGDLHRALLGAATF
jgi:serine/threonine-protein kinase